MLTITTRDLSEKIRAGNVMVFTGAGMSTESGLPDFRSNDGLWHGKDPMTIASTYALENNFEEFTEFYRYRLRERNKYAPHKGHMLLGEWEAMGLVNGVITQNVDGFHRQAGTKRWYELHGSLDQIYCHTCRQSFSVEEYMSQNYCSCGGKIRPGIVLFGEALPMETFEASIQAVRTCSTLLVIGTSLEVSPANYLPAEARTGGAEVILINRDPISHSYMVDAWMKGNAKEILEEVHRDMINR